MNLVGCKEGAPATGGGAAGACGSGQDPQCELEWETAPPPLVGEGGSAKPRRMRGSRGATSPLIRPAGTFSHKGRREAGSGGGEFQQLDGVEILDLARLVRSTAKQIPSPLVGEGGSAKPRRMRGWRVTGPLIRPAGTFSHEGRRETGSGGGERQQLDDLEILDLARVGSQYGQRRPFSPRGRRWIGEAETDEGGGASQAPSSALRAPSPTRGEGKRAQEAANFKSLMASKSWTPPPTRLVV